MKRLLLGTLLLSAPSFAEDFSISDLSGGMWSNASPNKLPDNTASSIENFFTDVEPIAIERSGYQLKDSDTVLGGTKAVTGLWEFVDSSGNEWIISYSSRTWYKNTSGNEPEAFGPTATTANIPDAAVNLAVIMFTNGIDNVWWFDGTSTGAVASAPKGRIIESWRERFVIADIASLQSSVHFSEDGDYTSWTVASNPTDPFILTFGGGNDGDSVTCLWGSYYDNLIVGKKRNTWIGSGFDQADIVVRNISREIGCLENSTMREKDGSLVWLSNRGMEKMTGTQIVSISEPIRDVIDELVKNSASERSAEDTADSDFNSGTITGDISVSNGSLSAKTTSFHLTSASDWNGGSGFNIFTDTDSSAGSIVTTFPDEFDTYRDSSVSGEKKVWRETTNPDQLDVETGVFSGKLRIGGDTNGVASAPLHCVRTIDPLPPFGNGATFYFEMEGSNNMDDDDTFYFSLSEGSTELSASNIGSIDDLNNFNIVFSHDKFKSVLCDSASDSFVFSSVDSLTPPEAITIYLENDSFVVHDNNAQVYSGNVGAGTTCLQDFDSGDWYLNICVLPTDLNQADQYLEIDNFTITPQSATVYHQFETGISSPIWSTFNADASTTQITFSISVSTGDGADFDNAVAITQGNAPSAAPKTFFQLNSLFDIDISSFPGSTQQLNSWAFGAGSSGTFRSQVFNTGGAAVSWGEILIADAEDQGTVTYSFNADDQSDADNFNASSWTTITSGQVPTNGTEQYAIYFATFVVTSGTGTARLDSFSFSWDEGTLPPPTSWVYDRRYWLAYTTSTAGGASNDSIAVLQRNDTWTRLTGINAASFAHWKDKLYFGDSRDNGLVYLYDIGNNDNNSNINSYILTKSYDMGRFVNEKAFQNLYTNYNGGATKSGNFTVGYSLDQSTNVVSLGTMNMNEIPPTSIRKMPFSIDNIVEGREIQYEIKKQGTGDRLKLYDLYTTFDLKEAR